jgi:hypothetical protein
VKYAHICFRIPEKEFFDILKEKKKLQEKTTVGTMPVMACPCSFPAGKRAGG